MRAYAQKHEERFLLREEVQQRIGEEVHSLDVAQLRIVQVDGGLGMIGCVIKYEKTKHLAVL